MAESPKTILEYCEIRARKNFDPDCGISVENIASLVTDYHFASNEEFPCQVERDGKRCEEDHRNGWLGRRKDGREALIGSTCGKKYFSANSTFAADRRRISDEQSIQSSLSRLSQTLQNPAFANDLLQTRERLKAVVTAVAEIRDKIPAVIASVLLKMAQDEQSSVIVRFRHEDEDDEGNPIVRWVPERVGIIAGLAIWNPEPMRLTFKELHEIRNTLMEAKPLRSAGRKRLRQWADCLDRLSFCQKAVDGYESRLSAFEVPENLKLLCLLVPNEMAAVAAARLVVERAGRQVASDSPRRLYNELRKSVTEQGGGRRFRID